MCKRQSVAAPRVALSDRIVDTLASLQECNNDGINMYIEHLDKVAGMLFKQGGDMDAAEPKNELFELLHINHLLRKDLEALKADN